MKTIRLGKHSANDYVVSEDTVSRYHAQMTITDSGEVFIRDLGSTNGTYIDGKKIAAETKLVAGNVVRLGNKVINWQEIAQKQPNATMVSSQPAPINAGQYLIGRDEKCQIRFSQSEVSSRHAMLEKNAKGGGVITDLGSTNGTFVNGQRIFSATELKKGDVVLLASKYPLKWEQYIPASDAPRSSDKGGFKWGTLAAVIAALIIIGCGVAYILIGLEKKMDGSEVYAKYQSAVCVIETNYAYSIEIDIANQQLAETALQLIGLSTQQYYGVMDGKLTTQAMTAFGTGFFISQDGKIATNRHVVRPWDYDRDEIAKQLELVVKSSLSKYSELRSILSDIHVKGHLLSAFIIPNGCMYSSSTRHQCTTYAVPDDKDVDVAIIQMGSNQLPNGVTSYIDINQAEIEEDAIKQGNKIFVIGFPMAGNASFVKDEDRNLILKNQIQEGHITQDRSDLDFGHNASTFGGASGSPVLNEYGHLIGVHHAGMSQSLTQGFNYAIKAKHLVRINNK